MPPTSAHTFVAEILERRTQRTHGRRIARREAAALRAAAQATAPTNTSPATARPAVAVASDGGRRRTRRSYATG